MILFDIVAHHFLASFLDQKQSKRRRSNTRGTVENQKQRRRRRSNARGTVENQKQRKKRRSNARGTVDTISRRRRDGTMQGELWKTKSEEEEKEQCQGNDKKELKNS